MNDISRLGEVLGRASILVCTECGVAIHVLDAEAHSVNCKATPRFPLPSQVGYHQDDHHQLTSPHRFPLAIDYSSPVNLAVTAPLAPRVEIKTPTKSSAVGQTRQKRKFKGRVKPEPPEAEPPLPLEPPLSEPKMEVDLSPISLEPIRKKAKVMLPNLSSPRGLRTLLPGK